MPTSMQSFALGQMSIQVAGRWMRRPAQCSSPTTPTVIDEQIVIGSIIPAVEIYDVYNGDLKWKYYLRKINKD